MRYKISNYELLKQMLRSIPDGDACLIWPRSLGEGYGRICKDYQEWHAHVLSYTLTFGPPPEGLCVLHNCPTGDNPACFRPDHLWVGTKGDNWRDCIAKGRHRIARGSGKPRTSKLTDEQVLEIRKLYLEGASQSTLAKAFSIAPATIYAIVRGVTWKHLKPVEQPHCDECFDGCPKCQPAD